MVASLKEPNDDTNEKRTYMLEQINEILNEILDLQGFKLIDIPVEVEHEISNRALSKAGIDKDLFVPLEIIQLRRSLGLESDRGCALTAGAYLDTELEKLLRGFFIKQISTANKLFNQASSLSSFSAKIDLCFCLGLISQKGHRDLHLIRKVRNEFAHVPTEITFENQKIADRCKELYHDAGYDSLSARKKFMRVTIGISAIIHAKAKTEPRRSPSPDIQFDTGEDQDLPDFNEFKKLFSASAKEFFNEKLSKTDQPT